MDYTQRSAIQLPVHYRCGVHELQQHECGHEPKDSYDTLWRLQQEICSSNLAAVSL